MAIASARPFFVSLYFLFMLYRFFHFLCFNSVVVNGFLPFFPVSKLALFFLTSLACFNFSISVTQQCSYEAQYESSISVSFERCFSHTLQEAKEQKINSGSPFVLLLSVARWNVFYRFIRIFSFIFPLSPLLTGTVKLLCRQAII